MSDIAIDVQGVSKRFRLFTEKATSLKERVVHAGRVVHEDLWALNDVSVTVREGETLGILGRNGSGKSTLLKCICGVLQPTSGRVVVRGELAGLLELGAGFQQDLSGRDNVYLNGMLLGLSRREVDRRFDEIVAFAELEKFIDNQVKFYSSGMYVRLGFAVAVTMEPDILVIDEVLSVGDERFQRKCLDRVREFQDQGRTIVLVTHSPDDVRSICDRALVLQDGHMVELGEPATAVRTFRERLLEAGSALSAGSGVAPGDAATGHATGGGAGPEGGNPGTSWGNTGLEGPPAGSPHPGVAAEGGAAGSATPRAAAGVAINAAPVGPSLGEVAIVSPSDGPAAPLGDLCLRVGYRSPANTHDVAVRLEVCNDRGAILFRTDCAGGELFDLPAGGGVLRFDVTDLPLLDGSFLVNVGLQNRLGGTIYDWRESACVFDVANATTDIGKVAMSVTARLGRVPEDR